MTTASDAENDFGQTEPAPYAALERLRRSLAAQLLWKLAPAPEETPLPLDVAAAFLGDWAQKH